MRNQFALHPALFAKVNAQIRVPSLLAEVTVVLPRVVVNVVVVEDHRVEMIFRLNSLRQFHTRQMDVEVARDAAVELGITAFTTDIALHRWDLLEAHQVVLVEDVFSVRDYRSAGRIQVEVALRACITEAPYLFTAGVARVASQ